jgi:hypothetical protein
MLYISHVKKQYVQSASRTALFTFEKYNQSDQLRIEISNQSKNEKLRSNGFPAKRKLLFSVKKSKWRGALCKLNAPLKNLFKNKQTKTP